jgi:hypothetical protein
MGQLFTSPGGILIFSLATMIGADWVFSKLTKRW